jgi:hypothetical protein
VELFAERKLRRRQLADDLNPKITGRGLRERTEIEAPLAAASDTLAGRGTKLGTKPL